MKKYIVSIPISEMWVFEVVAKNKREVLRKLKNNDTGGWEQVCSNGLVYDGSYEPTIEEIDFNGED